MKDGQLQGSKWRPGEVELVFWLHLLTHEYKLLHLALAELHQGMQDLLKKMQDPSRLSKAVRGLGEILYGKREEG